MTALLPTRRRTRRLLSFGLLAFLVSILVLGLNMVRPERGWTPPWQRGHRPSNFDWAKRAMAHPIPPSDITPLPQGTPLRLRRIQHDFRAGGDEEGRRAGRGRQDERARRETLAHRRDAVRDVIRSSWAAYRRHAWGYDQLMPLSLGRINTFGGWGATLVDSLDTLWIAGLRDEFAEAAQLVARIDWDASDSRACSVFETTIRYLGGLLAAHDLSGDRRLLRKAVELGDMMYAAFDTPSHMPAGGLNFAKARAGRAAQATRVSLAVLGTMSLEFTRLSQLTGDAKYYSAVNGVKREMLRTQNQSSLPGLWPTHIDVANGFALTETAYSLGGSADSGFEYLSKSYQLLGGLDPDWARMHADAMDTARRNLLFRPMLPDDDDDGRGDLAASPDVLFAGAVSAPRGGQVMLRPAVEHLSCFAGGMFALGGRLFDRPGDVDVGEQLARGCAWAYNAFPSGIMPESSMMLPCAGAAASDKDGGNNKKEKDKTPPLSSSSSPPSPGNSAVGRDEVDDDLHNNMARCGWDERRWKKATGGPHGEGGLPRGFTAATNPAYYLRPEAIESVFVLYRITGKRDLQDVAWRMFEAVRWATATPSGAHAALKNVRTGPDPDSKAAGRKGGGSGGWRSSSSRTNRPRARGQTDTMESFWIAETLKYFYLIFSDEDLISLDEWVFNTEAHPLRVPRPEPEEPGPGWDPEEA